jgi:hypothetical protein
VTQTDHMPVETLQTANRKEQVKQVTYRYRLSSALGIDNQTGGASGRVSVSQAGWHRDVPARVKADLMVMSIPQYFSVRTAGRGIQVNLSDWARDIGASRRVRFSNAECTQLIGR